MKRQELYVLTAIVVVAVVIALLILTGVGITNPEFKPILNLAGVNSSNKLVSLMQAGISNHSEFNLTYHASAKLASTPLAYTAYSASLSVYRNASLFGLSMRVSGQADTVYSSMSEYNGTGFILCIGNETACAYNKSEQTGNFSSELLSALSGLFSSSFLSSPYLKMMENNYRAGSTNGFALAYLNTQIYDGEECSYTAIASNQNFFSSTGTTVNGSVCISEALGLPVYGYVNVHYSSAAVSITFGSSLAAG